MWLWLSAWTNRFPEIVFDLSYFVINTKLIWQIIIKKKKLSSNQDQLNTIVYHVATGTRSKTGQSLKKKKMWKEVSASAKNASSTEVT